MSRYPISYQNGRNRYPIYQQKGWKTLPFGAAHTYKAHIREYPPRNPLNNRSLYTRDVRIIERRESLGFKVSFPQIKVRSLHEHVVFLTELYCTVWYKIWLHFPRRVTSLKEKHEMCFNKFDNDFRFIKIESESKQSWFLFPFSVFFQIIGLRKTSQRTPCKMNEIFSDGKCNETFSWFCVHTTLVYVCNRPATAF